MKKGQFQETAVAYALRALGDLPEVEGALITALGELQKKKHEFSGEHSLKHAGRVLFYALQNVERALLILNNGRAFERFAAKARQGTKIEIPPTSPLIQAMLKPVSNGKKGRRKK